MFGSWFAFLPPMLFTTRTPAKPQAGDVLSVMPFLGLARELATLIVPVSPATQFRDDLELSLTAAARQQRARLALAGYDAVDLPVEREGFERRWVIGAAAAAVGSAVSIAGIVAYVWWHRSERVA